jgi:hypothetical protein
VIFGTAIGVLAASTALAVYAVSNNGRVYVVDWLILISGPCGGAVGGILYRALLVYKYPHVLSDTATSGSTQ